MFIYRLTPVDTGSLVTFLCTCCVDVLLLLLVIFDLSCRFYNSGFHGLTRPFSNFVIQISVIITYNGFYYYLLLLLRIYIYRTSNSKKCYNNIQILFYHWVLF